MFIPFVISCRDMDKGISKNTKSTTVELMAPAGSYEALLAAINAGADSVYFGVEQLNMRARAANNFTIDDLKQISEICKKHGVNGYLTLNTILYDHDSVLLKKICDAAKASGVSAVIASDMAAILYAHSIKLPVHISTQANVCNIETVKFFSQFADVMVLARELTLSQIEHITAEIAGQNICGPSGQHIKIELFAHGALCVAVSGKCYMSIATYNASANRGACLQNCRRSYKVIDEETGDELVIDNKYVMSPKDLCTIGFIDKLIEAGVSVLKIEGRARKADYVHTTVTAYREAIDSYFDKTYSAEKIAQWKEQLATVYNRGFWDGGYYLGKKLGEWSGSYGSQATQEKQYIGKVLNYFDAKKIVELHLECGTLSVGDALAITGTTTGIVNADVLGMYLHDLPSEKAVKGDTITLPLAHKVRRNDKVFVMRKTTSDKL